MRFVALALVFMTACGGASPAAPERDTKLDSILAFADHVAPGLGDVTDRIRLAAADPQAYRRRFADDSARTADDSALPRVALEAALVTHDRIAIIDWRDAPEDVLAALGPVVAAARPGTQVWTEAEARDWTEGETLSAEDAQADRFLPRIADRLASHGLRWIDLGGGTDGHALVLVPSAQFDRGVDLARAAGYSTR